MKCRRICIKEEILSFDSSSNFLIMKDEALRSSETSVNFYQTTWCHISRVNTIHNYSGNLRSYKRMLRFLCVHF
jgi:hypothetical protein